MEYFFLVHMNQVAVYWPHSNDMLLLKPGLIRMRQEGQYTCLGLKSFASPGRVSNRRG